jgi:hypothetical protein
MVTRLTSLILIVSLIASAQYLPHRRGAFRASESGPDEYTTLLLHFDGEDASTTFTDSSAMGHTVTAYGDAQVATANKQFGTGALLLDGTGDYLLVDNSAAWDLGTGDWTIEFFAYFDSLSNDRGVVSTSSGSANGYVLQTAGGDNMKAQTTASGSWATDLAMDISALSIETWTHVALVRYGNDLTWYAGGVAAGTTDVTGYDYADQNNAGLVIGRYFTGTNNYYFSGAVDELRISNTARYTGNFTPPVAAFE